MNVFSMERIFKRSDRNKNLFFGADTYCYPLMFYMVSDIRLPDCRFCDSEEVAESALHLYAFGTQLYSRFTEML